MNIDNAINKFKSYHPIMQEDKEAFERAIHCMEFARDFVPLGATPERMTHALNLVNSLQYIFSNETAHYRFNG